MIVLTPFVFLARYGRLALPLGLLAGVLLPGLALALKPWLAELVLALLFCSSFRLAGPVARRGIGSGGWPERRAFGAILVLQLLLPLSALMVFGAFGVASAPWALAVVLVLAAPSVTGSPNFTQLLGHDPDPAFRLLLLGTAFLPLTMLPIFWLTPDLGNVSMALIAAFKLLLAIAATVGAALLLRRLAPERLSPTTKEALDGGMVALLVIMVIGLMAALGPALIHTPWLAAGWLLLAIAINFGLQVTGYLLLRHSALAAVAAPYALVAGNRNFALFLVALPSSTVDQLLIFLGCYQIPMYLTPLMMRRFYRPQGGST